MDIQPRSISEPRDGNRPNCSGKPHSAHEPHSGHKPHSGHEPHGRPELVSESIAPQAGTFDTTRMGRGEPGLPKGFTWRGQAFVIERELLAWKQSGHEGGAAGDLYLRRHYYKLLMGDARVWTVYFVRQTPRTGNPKNRWFLYVIE